VITARKHLHNVKVSNVTGEYIQEMAYFSATVVAGKLYIQGQGYAGEILSCHHFPCDKCDKQFPDIESLCQHKAKDHGTSYQCNVCKELEAREATGIGYICCVCDAEFEIATELEDHMSMHDNVLPH
jgi:hypothetical protein